MPALLNPFDISQAELVRVAVAAYNGKSYRVSLAYDPSETLTLESTTAAYDALKLSGSGYADITGTIGTGAIDATEGRLEVATGTGANTWITAQFGPFSADKTYNVIYIVVDGHTSIYGRRIEAPAITIASGFSTRPYPFQFVIDDAF